MKMTLYFLALLLALVLIYRLCYVPAAFRWDLREWRSTYNWGPRFR